MRSDAGEVIEELFDDVIDRRDSESLKWHTYESDVLPMWVADMDFSAPRPVIDALHARVAHGIFGYAMHPLTLAEVICERLEWLYRWRISPDWISFVPGVVPAFNLAIRSTAKPGGELLIQTPVYPPFLKAAANSGMAACMQELTRAPDGFYKVDPETFNNSIDSDTCAFLLCNPHNPVGRVFTRSELALMAETCLRHRIVIISDEIHCDLIFSGHSHTPIASISPEIAVQSITLMAPSKTFNIAGLECAFAIIPDAEMRRKFEASRAGLVPGVNILALEAGLAAYRAGQPWLAALLRYLERNRDFTAGFVKDHLPGITMTRPEGTFLAWLDCRSAGLPSKPAKFFLKNARVALNEGSNFGPGGNGFVRLNFACPRALLAEGLERMAHALEVKS